MNDCKSHRLRSHRGPGLWTILLVAPAFVGVACASAPEPQVTDEDLRSVQERVEDVERTNGRMMVRVEEMERQMALVQDRVESNRIALQRQGYLGGSSGRFAQVPQSHQDQQRQRPDPAPESNYPGQQRQQQPDTSQGYQADPTMRQRMEDRGYKRIPLSDQQSGHRQQTGYQQQQQHHQPEQRGIDDPAGGQLDYDAGQDGTSGQQTDSAESDQDPIVITNETLEQQFGSSSSSSTTRSDSSTSSSEPESNQQSEPKAHVPVTSERLPTSDELEYEPEEQRENQREEAAEESDDDAVAVDIGPRRDGSPKNNVEIDRWFDGTEDELLELYQDSLAEYRDGDYGEALYGFRQFLEAGPADQYIDNALYWIGECHYGLGEYNRSIEYFDRIIDELPSADKVPDAMLKKSLAYNRLGDSSRAANLLEKLIDEYPNTNPARLGEERLEEFTQNGEL